MDLNSCTEICEKIFRPIKKELFNRLKAGEHIHGTKIYQIKRKMTRQSVPMWFADQFMENQLYDMRMQIAEQVNTSA